MVEKIVMVAVVLTVGVVAVRLLGQSKRDNLACQGETIQNLDGTTRCGGGGDPAAAAGPPTVVAAAPEACRGGKCICFVAGTPVLTENGLQAIETIQPGTLVWSRDQDGEARGWKPVLHTFVSHARALARITVSDAVGRTETLETTTTHPFNVDGRGWIDAGQLQPGADAVNAGHGRPLVVHAAEEVPQAGPVYNLEVADFHTYFVGQLGSWVHNGPLDDLRRKARPVIAANRFKQRQPIGKKVPVKVVAPGGNVAFRGDAEVIRVNGDGTYDVQFQINGKPYQGRSDGRGTATLYPNVGDRVNFQRPDGTTDSALVFGRNPDGSAEVEGNTGGRRWSGQLPLGNNTPTEYPQPTRPQYQPNQPIGGIVPTTSTDASGQTITSIGNIHIIHPDLPTIAGPAHVQSAASTFVNDTLSDLATIGGTTSGQALLDALTHHQGPEGGTIDLQFADGYGYGGSTTMAQAVPDVPFDSDQAWDENNHLPGYGVGSTVFYNPSLSGGIIRPHGEDPAIAAVFDEATIPSFRGGWGRAMNLPTDVVLFHELVHASDFSKGIDIGSATFGGSSIGVSEEHAVGLGDFASAPFSENKYRPERHLAPRPFYESPTGEVYSTEPQRNFGVDWYLGSHTGAPGTAVHASPAPSPSVSSAGASNASVTGVFAPSPAGSAGAVSAGTPGSGAPSNSTGTLPPAPGSGAPSPAPGSGAPSISTGTLPSAPGSGAPSISTGTPPPAPGAPSNSTGTASAAQGSGSGSRPGSGGPSPTASTNSSVVAVNGGHFFMPPKANSGSANPPPSGAPARQPAGPGAPAASTVAPVVLGPDDEPSSAVGVEPCGG